MLTNCNSSGNKQTHATAKTGVMLDLHSNKLMLSVAAALAASADLGSLMSTTLPSAVVMRSTKRLAYVQMPTAQNK